MPILKEEGALIIQQVYLIQTLFDDCNEINYNRSNGNLNKQAFEVFFARVKKLVHC
jgi:hypothetical protein